MKKYNQVEGILYSHYRKKNKIALHKGALSRTEKRIQQLEKELKECKIDIEDDLQSVTYEKDKIITSSNTQSTMEKALIRAETKMERELRAEKAYKYKIKDKIRRLQKEIDSIEVVLESLEEDDKELIHNRYKGRMSYRKIAYDIPCDEKTVRRNKDRIIKELAKRLSEEY